MTQKERILERLQNGQALTAHDAKQQLGIQRLAARIYDLRRDGHPIQARTIRVPTRYGETTTVSEYFLPQGQTELNL